MSDEEKILLYEERIETIESVLMGKASVDVKSYEINGRTIDRYSMGELMELSRFFSDKLATLKSKTNPRRVLTRFA